MDSIETLLISSKKYGYKFIISATSNSWTYNLPINNDLRLFWNCMASHNKKIYFKIKLVELVMIKSSNTINTKDVFSVIIVPPISWHFNGIYSNYPYARSIFLTFDHSDNDASIHSYPDLELCFAVDDYDRINDSISFYSMKANELGVFTLDTGNKFMALNINYYEFLN